MTAGNSRQGGRGLRRLGALGLGLGILVLAELLLRLFGFGGPGQRPDPFAGFAPDEPLFVQSEDATAGAVLRTHPERVGQFNLESFPRRKDPGTIRIFCLGGSSTFGFPYDGRLSFCSALERGLRILHPETRFQVVNCGGMSYGARRVLNVMRELAAYEADAFVVYMGHNEYVERRFFAPFLEEAPWRRRLRAVLHRVRLYIAARRLLEPFTRPQATLQEAPFGIPAPRRDDSRRLLRDAREDALVAEQFAFVLGEMRAVAAAGSSDLFLILPAANLRDWAPEGSMWDPDLAAESTRERDAATAAARRLHQAGRQQEALAAIDQALALDPQPAASHYLRGRILLAMGQAPAAAAALRRARDLDAVPIRITGPLGDLIVESWADAGLDPLDAQGTLDGASPHGITGNEMVLDYCHPSPEGHRHIAALVLPALQRRLWPEAAVRRLPPERLLPAGGEGAAAAPSAFGAAWAGQMLVRQGRLGEAEDLFRRALELDPALATAHEGLGRILTATGRIALGVQELEEAARLAPGLSNVWNNLGQAYRAAGRLEDALAAYRRAAAAGVGQGVVHRNLAATLLLLERPEEALLAAREACRLSPGDALAWVQLGQVQATLGQLEAAESSFRRALELDPGAAAAQEALEALSPNRQIQP